jgi:hypothetical protein
VPPAGAETDDTAIRGEWEKGGHEVHIVKDKGEEGIRWTRELVL